MLLDLKIYIFKQKNKLSKIIRGDLSNRINCYCLRLKIPARHLEVFTRIYQNEKYINNFVMIGLINFIMFVVDDFSYKKAQSKNLDSIPWEEIYSLM